MHGTRHRVPGFLIVCFFLFFFNLVQWFAEPFLQNLLLKTDFPGMGGGDGQCHHRWQKTQQLLEDSATACSPLNPSQLLLWPPEDTRPRLQHVCYCCYRCGGTLKIEIMLPEITGEVFTKPQDKLERLIHTSFSLTNFYGDPTTCQALRMWRQKTQPPV